MPRMPGVRSGHIANMGRCVSGSHAAMRPWREASGQALARCWGVFTDIDDTLTREGVIEPAALKALHDLHAAQVPVIAITGRPMGWSMPFAAAWPVAAIVAENGAVALCRSSPSSSLRVAYVQDAATREHNAKRLREVAHAVQRALPHARLAADSAGRVTDIAVDHSEHAHLNAADTACVVRIMREAGMQASVSSIHINGWFGSHSKWSGACWIVDMLYGRDLHSETGQWLYVGDSTNDQVMFERFEHAVGVANLMAFARQLTCWPAYLTDAERGEGFAEVAATLVAARGPT
jgi:HAD superfamily hydrolase (TIGR01484 family)